MNSGAGSLNKRIDDLSPQRRTVLEKLLQHEGDGLARPPVIQRRSELEVVPLSYAQQRLWFLDQLMPGNTIFNQSSAYRIREAVDEAVLERSLSEIVRRHESLRTTFKVSNREPFQAIAPRLRLPLRVVDLRPLTDVEREVEAVRLIAEERECPFDLERGPLIRTALLRLADEDCIFVLSMHHIITDMWSMGVFWTELSAIWEAFAAGKPSPLPDLPIQYADFAVWERDWLQGDQIQRQLAYWKKQLADLTVLQLPMDFPRPATRSNRGAVHNLMLSSRLTSALRSLSQRSGATLFMTLLAGFQSLLFRYSGQEDVAIGAFVANRSRAETEGLIGFFVNTLVLRTDFSGEPSFQEVLRRVRAMTLDAYAHQALPFARLVQELRPERNLSGNPLVQVAFQLLNVPGVSQADSDILDVPRETAILDLTFSVWESADSLGGEIEYNRDLFKADTIQRMVGHYQTLLEGIVEDPDRCVCDLPLLSDGERRQVVVDWNATTADYPDEESIVSLFEGQVARSPDAIAFRCAGKDLTYQQLNRRANQFARYLRALGVRQETRVGVCLDRSLDLIVGLLAILKAGAAYVPLDAAYPNERLAYMVADAGLTVLVTAEGLVERLPEHGARVVRLDYWRPTEESEENLALPIAPDDLAYVIYTSGSTGRPKGVLAMHRAAVNRFAWMWKAYPFATGEVCCARTSLSFVDSVWEIFGPLLQGVPTVIIPDDQLKDLPQIVRSLAENHVSRLVLVPSVLRTLLDSFTDLRNRLPELTVWVTSGEALATDLGQRFHESLPDRVLINLYGSSEVAGDVTCFEVSKAAVCDVVPIGRPISNVQTYIVDRHFQPLPVGVPGELLVGGAALARGYHNQPDLTAEKFIANPFDQRREARLYRTGDRARYLPDGNIEFLGRLDQQVKIRGFRIEPGEIEAALVQHPAVRDAVVVARPDDLGEESLIAYIVPNSDDGGSIGYLGQDLSKAEPGPSWQEVWDETYRQKPTQADPTFNITGWNSSYTGLPIPVEEMREWTEQAVARVRALEPRRVLEIGCGVGLLLFRIAPMCTRYCGTDFSPVALRYLEQQIEELNLAQVTLLRRTAEDFTGFEDGSFDTVVLNSVAQYFPHVDTLVRVLEGAVRVVQPGGSIFLGDVRSRPLLGSFHTTVELHRAPDSLPLAELQQRVRRRVIEDEELAIDPAFFFAIQRHLPQISHVQVEPKRGHYRNELTRFRYEVTLRVDSGPERLESPVWLDWQKEQLSLPAIRQVLRLGKLEAIGITRIPDARLTREIKAWELLAGSDGLETVGDLRSALDGFHEEGVDPEDICALEAELPYSVQLHWAGLGADGLLTVLFRRRDASPFGGRGVGLPVFPIETDDGIPWSAYTNNPLGQANAQRLVPELRRYLQAKLPDYMVPATVVILESLPLTPTGKLDRRALPAPDRSRPARQEPYVIPRTRTEELIAEIWAQLLGVAQVGAYDNFFELGGHSLLAIRVLSGMRDVFHLDLPLSAIFEASTIAELARLVDEAQARGEVDKSLTIRRLSREAHLATLLPGGVLDPSDLSKGRRRETRATDVGP